MNRPRSYRILLVAPSALVEAGVRKIVSEFSEFRLLDTPPAADPSQAFDRIAVAAPDLVLLDPAIFPVMRRASIRTTYPALQEMVLVALCHGPTDEELLQEFDGAINLYDSPAQIHRKLKHALESDARPVPSGNGELTEREREILVAVARGKTNREIAESSCISIHTVISHRKNITRKTGIKTIAGLTLYALLHNMISEEMQG